jgi:hypothetical protein
MTKQNIHIFLQIWSFYLYLPLYACLCKFMHMRTTLDLDNKLLALAMKATGKPTKTAVIHFALEEIIRKANLESLLQFGGKIKIDFDVASSRGRN